MRMTNGKGVDVILNSLAGEFLRRTCDCIGPLGRFIEIGKKDAQNNGKISLVSLIQSLFFRTECR
jgi:NADPH:quinone reductase-like Zn-dependent oxidoreductase